MVGTKDKRFSITDNQGDDQKRAHHTERARSESTSLLRLNDTNRNNRRTFLKHSSACAAALLFSGHHRASLADQPYPDPLPDYSDPDYPDNDYYSEFPDNLDDSDLAPFDADEIPTPRLKPETSQMMKGNWTQLADMPFPVQEVYPAPFWTERVASQQTRKALKAQRFNILVNAGGIIRVENGRVVATRQVSVYDPIADRWDKGPSLPGPAHHVQLVPHNGFLFAMGGFSSEGQNHPGWSMRRSIYRLSSLSSRWERYGEMPNAQAEAVCASLNGFIHVVGGRSPVGSRNANWNDHIDTDRHSALDVRTGKWVEAAPMTIPRNSAAGVAVNGFLYVMGGRRVTGGNLNITEAYDPLADRWQTMRPMPQAQAGLAAAAIGSTIYVFGGEYFDNGGGVYSKVWAYDTQNDRWRSVTPMPRPRHGLGAVSLNGAIYIVGGAAKPGGSLTSNVLDRFLLEK